MQKYCCPCGRDGVESGRYQAKKQKEKKKARKRGRILMRRPVFNGKPYTSIAIVIPACPNSLCTRTTYCSLLKNNGAQAIAKNTETLDCHGASRRRIFHEFAHCIASHRIALHECRPQKCTSTDEPRLPRRQDTRRPPWQFSIYLNFPVTFT